MGSIKKYVAECIGTAVLVTFGCGTAVAVGCNTPGGYFMTALAFGLVIVAMAYSIGNVSGCHINPAVSIAMLALKKLSVKDFIGYVISQCIGAFAGCGILAIVFGKDCGFGANAIQAGWENGSNGTAFVVELVLTFVFVLAIVGVTSKASNGAVAGIVIGLTLTMVHILGIALTGTSVNPARSFAPAILAGGEALKQVWIFLLAPLVGGVLAACVYRLLDKEA